MYPMAHSIIYETKLTPISSALYGLPSSLLSSGQFHREHSNVQNCASQNVYVVHYILGFQNVHTHL